MHIHDSVPIQSLNIVPSAAAEQGMVRLRSESLRKRMLSSLNETDGVNSPEEAEMISHWMKPRRSVVLEDDEYHPSSERHQDIDFE